jgi:hypothetical protein
LHLAPIRANRAHSVSETSPRPELPPGIAGARADVDDPDAAEERGTALMAASGPAILEGVKVNASRYVFARSVAVLDAWSGARPTREGDRDVEAARLHDAAEAARDRVVSELEALLALDPSAQARTPLEIVRSVRREPTEVLAAIGVGAIARDPFEERALPDDPYALAPRTLADLGDDDLGPLQLAWGLGKSTVLRARAARAAATEGPVDNLSITARAAEIGRSSLGTMSGTISRVWTSMRNRAERDASRALGGGYLAEQRGKGPSGPVGEADSEREI